MSRQGVGRWLGDDEASRPSGGNLVRLALRAQLSPNWLLLGMGQPDLGVTQPVAAIDSDLRSRLVADLVARTGMEAARVAEVLPEPEQLYDQILRAFLPRVRERVLSRLEREVRVRESEERRQRKAVQHEWQQAERKLADNPVALMVLAEMKSRFGIGTPTEDLAGESSLTAVRRESVRAALETAEAAADKRYAQPVSIIPNEA